jgi:Ras GTPase-activating-like protein IQGAP2/3
MQRNITEDQIMELKEVKDIVQVRIEQLQQICDQFFEGIIKNLNKLPYGIRWICKQIRKIAQESFKDSSEDDILKVTGYFVYYRFINLAIVTPDAFEIIDKELQPVARKNLVSVSTLVELL